MIALLAAAALSAAQIHTIETSVRQSMAARQIPSVVVRVDVDGTNVYSKAFGYRDVANRAAADDRTRYQYGSITKQFTAAAVLALQDDGKLSIDDRIGKWLPAFAKFPVTIRQLLIHTGAVADFTEHPWYLKEYFTNPFVNYEPLLKWSASQPLEFAPGSKAQYDNAGYVILARIVEKASGKTFFDYLKDRFFSPLGMTSVAPQTFFRIEPDTANGYMFAAIPELQTIGLKSKSELFPAIAWNLEQADGAGFLVGDAADLQKWDDALLGHRVFTGAAEKLFYTAGRLGNGKPAYTGPENPARRPAEYCYGGVAKFTGAGYEAYGANGGTPGFLAFTATIPAQHIALTILTNHGADLDNSKLTNPVLAALVTK
ncbi:MAG TPA: serine hydrolase domain-containing protein [Candidatus Baltobacteraceae bacterium]|jgi:CubicO group peptidase (beta-lactamase class C family)